LERVGVHISSEYPPASERTENLRRALRELTESDLDVDEMLTIAVALQELMDDVDDVIAGVARRTHVDIYRSYVGLLSRLEEVVRGRITEAEFIRGVEEIARNLGMDRMRKVANHLANSYPLYPFGNPQPSRRELMGERLREMYPQLPLDLRTLFHN
jgi:Arc/MetJ family transcription regulator